MRMSETCARCLYDRQREITDDPAYLAEIRQIIDGRSEGDTAPYLVSLFDKVYERYFGSRRSYREIKRKYNDLVLSMEGALRAGIEAAADPLAAAFAYARIGNYIDFGALPSVDEGTFLSLFDGAALQERDRDTMESFLRRCETAERFLLIADNCGEIVLDKLFIQQLKKRFPRLKAAVMVRGSEVLNDATAEDAEYAGLADVAEVIPNGTAIAGTVYERLTEEARAAIDSADVILAKGQGNYESLCAQGRRIFYAFLCKCDLFTDRFGVPRFTGMFLEES